MQKILESGVGVRFVELTKKHYFLIVITLGSLLIAFWTLIRFWSSKTIFDLIGQQVLAQSLLKDGVMDGTVGATHYILKLFLVYIPFARSHIDPRLGLVLMTLLINITSFVLMAFALRSIARSFGVFRKEMFAIALIWFASLAGSILWIEFANSRNIEIAAGLWLVAIGLKILNNPRLSLGISFVMISTVTFFMDPLQVYMTALPLLVFGTISSLITLNKHRDIRPLKRAGVLALILAFSYFAAKLLLVAVESKTGLRVIDGQSSILGITSVHQLIYGIKGLMTANIRVFSGYVADGGRLRQAVALAGVLLTAAAWILLAIKKKIPSTFAVFIVVFLITIESIYLFSGQSLNGDTSRYLVMSAPIFVLLIGSLPIEARTGRIVAAGLAITLVCNVVAISGLFVVASRDTYIKDGPLSQVESVVAENKDTRFYGSMDTALPTMYYYPNAEVLPLSCSGNGLSRAETFYPKSSFEKYQSQVTKFRAVILDNGKVITNYPFTCSEESIVKQLGAPLRQTEIADGFTVLYYPQGSFSF